jgi:hypothetical protein
MSEVVFQWREAVGTRGEPVIEFIMGGDRVGFTHDVIRQLIADITDVVGPIDKTQRRMTLLMKPQDDGGE